MTSLRLDEITPGFGAEVEGWDPAAELDPATVEELRRAFDRYGVLVFHDVDVPAEAQQYLCGLLVGDEPPADRATAQANSHLYSTRISNRDADGNAPYGVLLFHADGMWSENPQELLSLYGEKVEQPAVPTVYASATRAWERLPDDLRARIDGRTAQHATGQRHRGGFDPEELLQAERSRETSRTIPIEQTHPRTGEPILYVSQMMTANVGGLSEEASEALLEELFAVLYDEEHAFTHEWREKDLVVWDNLAVQHFRPPLRQDGPERSLRKVAAPKTNMQGAEKPRFARQS